MHWEWAALSDTGRRRSRNEDSFLARPEKRLYAVADGMGGHAAGDVASRMAIELLDRHFDRAPACGTQPAEIAESLREAAEEANRAILARGIAEPEKLGMGTTLTALSPLCPESGLVIVHIGDSRAYRMRDDELVQLTVDHTWVQRQIEEGKLTAKQARRHPLSSVLTRVLGTPELEGVDVVETRVEPGDLYLLCSDGLTSMVDDADLRAILHGDWPLQELSANLVDAANLRGGHDNITVLLLRAMEGDR
jgi:protein phosphatase